jgi:hypothetical protein
MTVTFRAEARSSAATRSPRSISQGPTRATRQAYVLGARTNQLGPYLTPGPFGIKDFFPERTVVLAHPHRPVGLVATATSSCRAVRPGTEGGRRVACRP